jgi:hypothetical protein
VEWSEIRAPESPALPTVGRSSAPCGRLPTSGTAAKENHTSCSLSCRRKAPLCSHKRPRTALSEGGRCERDRGRLPRARVPWVAGCTVVRRYQPMANGVCQRNNVPRSGRPSLALVAGRTPLDAIASHRTKEADFTRLIEAAGRLASSPLFLLSDDASEFETTTKAILGLTRTANLKAVVNERSRSTSSADCVGGWRRSVAPGAYGFTLWPAPSPRSHRRIFRRWMRMCSERPWGWGPPQVDVAPDGCRSPRMAPCEAIADIGEDGGQRAESGGRGPFSGFPGAGPKIDAPECHRIDFLEAGKGKTPDVFGGCNENGRSRKAPADSGSVVFRKQNGCDLAVGLSDDPELGAVSVVVDEKSRRYLTSASSFSAASSWQQSPQSQRACR